MQNDLTLTAISPLDGRYHTKCAELNKIASEYGLMYYRLIVEVKWLQKLATLSLKEIPPLSKASQDFLNKLIQNFNIEDADAIKSLEATTNHDVKAIEYFIKNALSENPELNQIKEFVHFGCTSEDINNLAYALMLKDIQEKNLQPLFSNLISQLENIVKTHKATPMLSRTHGQPATPTTLGKEIANVVARLQKQLNPLQTFKFTGKFNGAVGNFNAHTIAYPEVAWNQVAEEFVTSLDLAYNPLTTQIEPHDNLAEYFHNLMRINTILIDFSRDVWGYISLGYFKQKVKATETGSSTMPHKVNPIDFENAEGNFGLANALFSHFAEKLPISRWQRDLSDSTVLRNIGVACGYMLIALKSLIQGVNKLEVNHTQINADLNANWEVLGEAIQTVMRRYGIEAPYEKLKSLTRDKKITSETLHVFIDSLKLPIEVQERLKKLTPSDYIGLAIKLTG